MNRKFIEKKIKLKGKILESGYDGDDMVWVVKTDSGDTIEFRYPR